MLILQPMRATSQRTYAGGDRKQPARMPVTRKKAARAAATAVDRATNMANQKAAKALATLVPKDGHAPRGEGKHNALVEVV